MNSRVMHSICAFILLCFIAPYIYLGTNSPLRIHDNLDGFGPYKMMVDSNMATAPGPTLLPQVFNGLPRVSLASERNYLFPAMLALGPFGAYILNRILIVAIAYLGMFLFLSYWFPRQPTVIRVVVSVCFALTPFLPLALLSVPSLPLVFYVFSRVRDGHARWWDWLVVALVPFTASFIFVYSFFLFIASGVWVSDLVLKRKLNLKLATAMILLFAGFVFVEYRLFEFIVLKYFESNRSAFSLPTEAFFKPMKSMLLFGHYHSGTNPKWPFWSLVFSWIVVGISYFKRREKIARELVWLSFICFAISAFYALWYWRGIGDLKSQVAILKVFNFSRFHWLLPFFTYVLFAVSLSIIWNFARWGRYVVGLFLVLNLGWDVTHHEFLKGNYSPRSDGSPKITYKGFYSEDLFREIRDYIRRDQSEYRVVSIGMHPTIATWNGFYTLDGYSVLYPLTYKQEFRKIIEPELAKSAKMTKYFDGFGGRVYIFSSELELDFSVEKSREIKSISLNYDQLRKMGGEYVLSAARIKNVPPELKLLKTFDSADSAWKIDLYKVN